MRVLRTPITVLAVAALAGLTLAACDDDSETEPEVSSSKARTVDIEMRDIAFSPDRVEVQAGETIRFRFHNAGEAEHDAFLGDAAAQDEHETEMAEEHGSMPDDEEAGIAVEPGETGELVHTFEAGEELLIGCHEPGHYAAGMKIAITVT